MTVSQQYPFIKNIKKRAHPPTIYKNTTKKIYAYFWAKHEKYSVHRWKFGFLKILIVDCGLWMESISILKLQLDNALNKFKPSYLFVWNIQSTFNKEGTCLYPVNHGSHDTLLTKTAFKLIKLENLRYELSSRKQTAASHQKIPTQLSMPEQNLEVHLQNTNLWSGWTSTLKLQKSLNKKIINKQLLK